MKKFLGIICSGLLGVLLTIGYQHFFAQQQEFTFVINGENVALTEPQLQEQLNTTQEELNTAKKELNAAKEELNTLKNNPIIYLKLSILILV